MLRGRGGADVRGLDQDALQIPLAIGHVHEVHAWIGEADGGGTLTRFRHRELIRSVACTELALMIGLAAKRRIFLDYQVLKSEAGEGQQVHRDIVEVHGTSQACTDAGHDAALKAIHVDERRQQRQQKNDEQHDADQGRYGARASGNAPLCCLYRRELNRFPA